MDSGALSNSQKTFLQAIMHMGFMDTHTVKSIYQTCREKYGESTSMEEMQGFLKDINSHLRFLDIEIRKGFDEDTGAACYVCVNTVENEYLLNSGKYNIKQMDYFKALLHLIIMSDDGAITTVDALNAVDSLETGFHKQDAVNMIQTEWVNTAHWLKGVSALTDQGTSTGETEYLTLGTRAIVELEHYIRENFTDYIKDCNICNRLSIRGLTCRYCECKVHMGCIRSYLSKQKADTTAKCPNKECNKDRPELLQFRKAQRSSQAAASGGH